MIIWDGNYNSLNEAQNNALQKRLELDSFEEQMFDVTKCYWKSFEILKELKEKSILLESCIFAYYQIYKERLSLADIGGGCGMHLIDICNSGLDRVIKKYYLIEAEKMSDYAKKMNRTKEKSIILDGFPHNFSSDEKTFNIDLIYLNASFQYIFPTEKSVEAMRILNPKIICIDRVFVGNIHTFYAVQKNLRHDIVAKFMNEVEFLKLFEANGYEIAFKYERPFNWNMDNFTEEMRLYKLPSYIFIQKNLVKNKERLKCYIDKYISQNIDFVV